MLGTKGAMNNPLIAAYEGLRTDYFALLKPMEAKLRQAKEGADGKSPENMAVEEGKSLSNALVKAGVGRDEPRVAERVAQGAKSLEEDLYRRQQEMAEEKAAAERLEDAKQRMRMLQLQARTAAVSGDEQEAARVAREAAMVANEVARAARELSGAQGGGAEPTGASAQMATVEASQPSDAQTAAAHTLSKVNGGVGGALVNIYIADARTLTTQARSLVQLVEHIRRDVSHPPEMEGKRPGREILDLAEARKEVKAAEEAIAGVSVVPDASAIHPPAPGTLFEARV